MKNKLNKLKNIMYNGEKVYIHLETDEYVIVSKYKEDRGKFSIKVEKTEK
jgi:hypothetical protein